MDKRIRELYVNLMQEIDDSDRINCEMKQAINALLKEEQKNMDSQEYGKYQDKVFQIAGVAEESGFVRGFKYAVHLLAECMKD